MKGAAVGATVLVPTHDHALLIPHAIRAIQAQTFRDFELFVIGDGAASGTREAVEQLARSDPRIRWFEFPKGARHGEAHRHVALGEARGRIVAYCGDDDLWLPGHLTAMDGLLRTADFGHSVQCELFLDGEMNVRPIDLAEPATRRAILTEGLGFFGLSDMAHTLNAYRRLPDGWTPAPAGLATDQHMIRKFLALPDLAGATAPEPSALHIASPLRKGWSASARERELARYARHLASGRLAAIVARAHGAALARAAGETCGRGATQWLARRARKLKRWWRRATGV